MRNYAAFMLSVLMVPFPRGDVRPHLVPSKYRSDEEIQAVMLLSKRVHPYLFFFRTQPALIPGGSPSLL